MSGSASLRVLVVTAMYPAPDAPTRGIFVQEQVEALRRLGVAVDVLVIDGRRTKLNYLRGCAQVLLASMRHTYDVVHGHYGYAGLVARCQLRAPVVVTLHGSDVNLASQRPFARLAARFADATIVVSAELARVARLPSAEVIPCGVDLTAFRPLPVAQAREALGLDGDDARPVVLFPADPARRIKRFDRFEAAISRLDRPVHVLVLANTARARVPFMLNAADCMVLTSASEGSPVVVREALACNTPVVSVDVGDVRQQLAGVHPGEVLVDPSPDDLAAAIQRVIGSGQRSNGRATVSSLDLDAIAARVYLVYERVATRHGRRASVQVRA